MLLFEEEEECLVYLLCLKGFGFREVSILLYSKVILEFFQRFNY